MKEIFSKLKIPLIVLAALLVGFIAYNSLKKPESETLLKTTAVKSGSPESNFLPLLLQVQKVTLDENLFLDPVFRALVDFSQKIVPESVGRANPFSSTLGAAANSSVESLGFVETLDAGSGGGAPRQE